jgi:hypothetical protein
MKASMSKAMDTSKATQRKRANWRLLRSKSAIVKGFASLVEKICQPNSEAVFNSLALVPDR